MREHLRGGFTLIELLVVIAVIAILLGILTPSLSKAKHKVRSVIGMNNQRQIASTVNIFEMDNDDNYPPSVATIGTTAVSWHWQEPTRLAGIEGLNPQSYRSMSEYLGGYIEDAGTMFCSNGPKKYKYLQEAWEAGDDWDNPQTPPKKDPVSGTYCFYWNYLGCLDWQGTRFIGPGSSAGRRSESKLLTSCYFGYDHWRSPNAYGSCEKFNGAKITQETHVAAAYWSLGDSSSESIPNVKLHATYTDGHVESYTASEVVPMKVSKTADGTVPYPDGIGPGIFYIPRNALR